MVSERMENLVVFTNLFGKQRFGVGHVKNPAVGLALLRSDYDRALALLLNRVVGDIPSEMAASDFFAEPAVQDRIREGFGGSESRSRQHQLSSTERKLLQAIKKQPDLRDKVKILNTLPRSLRRLFVESWQSSVWNELARRRVELHGYRVIAGDTVLISKTEGPAGGAGGKPVSAWDFAQLPFEGFTVHEVTESESLEECYSMEHVVVPLLGMDVRMPAWAPSLLDQGALVPNDLTHILKHGHKQRTFTLKGSYRFLLVKPKQVAVGHPTPDQDKVSVVLSFELPSAAYATELLATVVGAVPSDDESTVIDSSSISHSQ